MVKKQKIALIGPGRMGINYAKVVSQNPLAELVAICGNSVNTTKNNGKQFNVPLYYDNQWKKMFDDISKIDTVIIASSEWAHFEAFKDCVKFRKNIILEKPIAVKKEEISKMEVMAKDNPDLKILVCYTQRFDPRNIKAKEVLIEKKLGKVGYLYSRRNADISAASRILDKFPVPYWITVHDIDLMRWFLDSEVKEVYASQLAMSSNRNLLITNLLFDNGTRGLIETVYYSNPLSGVQHSRLDIECEKGKIEIELSENGIKEFNDDQKFFSPDTYDFINSHGLYTGNTPNMINYFIKEIAGLAKPFITFNDGIQAVKVSEAIQESLTEKKVIKL